MSNVRTFVDPAICGFGDVQGHRDVQTVHERPNSNPNTVPEVTGRRWTFCRMRIDLLELLDVVYGTLDEPIKGDARA